MWRGSRMKSNCIPWTDGSGLTHQGHCETMEGSEICFSALRSGCWRIRSMYNTHSRTEGLSLFVFFAPVQICHGSPESSPPSISLSFQTRLTSISAGRRGIEMNAFQFEPPLWVPAGVSRVYFGIAKWEPEPLPEVALTVSEWPTCGRNTKHAINEGSHRFHINSRTDISLPAPWAVMVRTWLARLINPTPDNRSGWSPGLEVYINPNPTSGKSKRQLCHPPRLVWPHYSIS